ncbi:hypothetical protein H8959_007421 [Pygathrix nigripes]
MLLKAALHIPTYYHSLLPNLEEGHGITQALDHALLSGWVNPSRQPGPGLLPSTDTLRAFQRPRLSGRPGWRPPLRGRSPPSREKLAVPRRGGPASGTTSPSASRPRRLRHLSHTSARPAAVTATRGPATHGPDGPSAGRGVPVRARASANRVLARPPPPRRGWRWEEEEEHSPSSYQRAGGGGGGTGVTNSDLSLTKTITNPPFSATSAAPPGPSPPPRSHLDVSSLARCPASPRPPGSRHPPTPGARAPLALPSAPGAARRRHGTRFEAALAPNPEVKLKEGRAGSGRRRRGRAWRADMEAPRRRLNLTLLPLPRGGGGGGARRFA